MFSDRHLDRMLSRWDVPFVLVISYASNGSSFVLQSIWIRHMRAARRSRPRRSRPPRVVKKGAELLTSSVIFIALRIAFGRIGPVVSGNASTIILRNSLHLLPLIEFGSLQTFYIKYLLHSNKFQKLSPAGVRSLLGN